MTFHPSRLARLVELDREIKEREKEKKEIREEFFEHADDSIGNLALRTVTLPHGFWDTTGLTPDQFFTSRYPQWRVVDKESDPEAKETTYLLEERPEYKSFASSAEIDGKRYVIARQVQNFDPEIDFVTLQKEHPWIFDAICKPRVVYELDEVAFNRFLREYPEALAEIQKHLAVKKPVKKLAPIREEKDDDG